MTDLFPDEKTRWMLQHGDCLDVLKTIPSESISSIVTDPPYGLSNHSADDVLNALRAWLDGKPYKSNIKGFMSKNWDSFVPGPEVWRECFRVLKPGGHMLVFSGTRTQDLMGIAIRLAGFDCRDGIRVEGCLAWMQSAGFPKSKNVSLSIDKGEGLPNRGRSIPTASSHRPGTGEHLTSNLVPPYEAQTEQAKAWEGWGTGLKPSWEPVLMFRKPLAGTVAETVKKYGTGAINIDGCRVDSGSEYLGRNKEGDNGWKNSSGGKSNQAIRQDLGLPPQGRWPSNLVFVHTPSCVQTGTRTVEAPVINRFDDGMKPFGEGAGHPYTTTGGGTEEIAIWECVLGCPVRALDEQSDQVRSSGGGGNRTGTQGGTGIGYMGGLPDGGSSTQYADTGGASRFFPQFQYTAEDAPFKYVSKTNRSERNEGLEASDISSPRDQGGRSDFNSHPTLKPIELMQWLVRLVTPPDGIALDPFAGSGSTGCAAIMEGMRFVGIEREAEYVEIARARITHHELKSRGGVRNPWTAPVPILKKTDSEPVSMADLFGFDDE